MPSTTPGIKRFMRQRLMRSDHPPAHTLHLEAATDISHSPQKDNKVQVLAANTGSRYTVCGWVGLEASGGQRSEEISAALARAPLRMAV